MWFVRLLSSVASLGKVRTGYFLRERKVPKKNTQARTQTRMKVVGRLGNATSTERCVFPVFVCVCLCHTSGQFALISLPVGCKYYGSMMMAACCFRLMDHRAESTSGDAHE